MKRLVITLFSVPLFLFSSPSFAIWEGVNKLPSWDDVPHEDVMERNTRILKESAKSD